MAHSVSSVLMFLLTFVVLQLSSISAGDMPAMQAKGRTFLGEVKILGNGVAWSWVECDEKGTPKEIGITFTETALSGLPEDPPSDVSSWEYELPLPKQCKVDPYNHIVVNWEPHGHIPPGIYDVPHFDFHFYMITSSERYKITAKGDDMARVSKKPPARFIPVGYILPDGTQMPRMGSHWIDPGAPEFNQQPFTYTFIYGSYNGRVNFIEPMISMAFLETKPNVTAIVKQPDAHQKSGHYPTTYSLRFDPERREYTVSLGGLTHRE